MEKYKNRGGDSGVSAFEIGSDYISVKFNGTSKIYTYSHSRAGRSHVDQMKLLARNGLGLNGYIKKYVNELYD